MKKNNTDEKLMQEILDEQVEFYYDRENPSNIFVEYLRYNGAIAFEPVDSKMFKAFLGFVYREESGENVMPDFSELLAIECQNLMYCQQGKGVTINRRVAGSISKGKILYFLADDRWTSLLIKNDGWKKARSKKIKFLRDSFDEAQAMPCGGGDLLKLLRSYVNMDEDSFILFAVYLVQAFSRTSSHFAAIISSDKGTGKTTLTKVMRTLIDPSKTGATIMPSNEGDLKNLLANGYMVCFDNTAALTTKFSNILCAAITGSKEAKRKLYTDCDQIILSLHNLVVLNGIDVVPHKSDLAERSLLFELQPISKGRRKTDDVFWKDFQQDRAAILGAILDTLAKAMTLLPSVEHKGLHRMADANLEMIAIAMALGLPQDEFQKILDDNKKKLQDAYNRMNPFLEFVVSFMRGRSDVDMAAEALYREMQSKIVGSGKFFPESPSALSRKLNQEREALLEEGYEFSRGEKKRDHNHLVIRRIPGSRQSQKQKQTMAHRERLLVDASTEE